MPVSKLMERAQDARRVQVVERALVRMEALDERQARIAEMRIFGGFEFKEIAEAIGLSESTVKRDWRIARAWLHREFGSPTDD